MGSNHLGSSSGYVPRDGLPMLKVGDQLSIDTLNKVIEGINRATVVAGNGYQVRRYSNSTVIQPSQYVSGGKFRNFQVYGFVDVSGQGFITCSIGTVNRVIPKVGNLYMDQVDSDKLPPKVAVSNTGYIVIEVTYDPTKPFPSQSEIKFVSQLETNMQQMTSQYPLASVSCVPANPAIKKPAEVLVSQIHPEYNLSVARIKVGQNSVFWQWWTI